jgi:replication-associated recombination protein RarA
MPRFSGLAIGSKEFRSLKEKQNLILIGMPGAGKTTIGVLLAKRRGLAFLDTDILMQTGEGHYPSGSQFPPLA